MLQITCYSTPRLPWAGFGKHLSQHQTRIRAVSERRDPVEAGSSEVRWSLKRARWTAPLRLPKSTAALPSVFSVCDLSSSGYRQPGLQPRGRGVQFREGASNRVDTPFLQATTFEHERRTPNALWGSTRFGAVKAASFATYKPWCRPDRKCSRDRIRHIVRGEYWR